MESPEANKRWGQRRASPPPCIGIHCWLHTSRRRSIWTHGKYLEKPKEFIIGVLKDSTHIPFQCLDKLHNWLFGSCKINVMFMFRFKDPKTVLDWWHALIHILKTVARPPNHTMCPKDKWLIKLNKFCTVLKCQLGQSIGTLKCLPSSPVDAEDVCSVWM